MSKKVTGLFLIPIGLVLVVLGLFPGTVFPCSTCNWWDLVCQAASPLCIANQVIVGWVLLLFGGIVLLLGAVMVIKSD